MIGSIFLLLLLCFIFLQGSITTLPLVLILLVVTYCFFRNDVIFIAACITGLFLDILLVYPVGYTSIYFLLSLFLIYLYQRKFEITSFLFIFVSSFLLSGGYILLFGQDEVLLKSSISSILAVLLAISFRLIYVNKKTSEGNIAW